MIVYHASKKGFINDVFNGTIADDIDHAFLLHLGRHTSPNEKLSWKNSMMHMYKVINTPDIPDASTIAIEYQIPLRPSVLISLFLELIIISVPILSLLS